jgi:20S proteasome alpha/beta subunit
MTLVAGFCGRDGILICADMEEVGVGASKRKINKLFCRTMGGVPQQTATCIVFTGAGSSAVIDNAIKRVDDAIARGSDISNENAAQDLIDSTLMSVYNKYVWPNQRVDHDIKLIVGYSHGFEQRLWITHDIVTMPEVRFVCAGIGEDLANYLADRLYHPQYSEPQIVRLAAFIFKEVKANVSGVGQGTQMWMLRKDGKTQFYDWREIEMVERSLPPFETTLLKYSWDITGPSVFPLLPFVLDTPYVEVCRDSGSSVLTGPNIHKPREIKKLFLK